ncbi:MAG: hypothetical protein GY696_33235 [Gammaproteobacteria bacterium]|nr:hypothetical protein [Gammaproteobacteria bacterium]
MPSITIILGTLAAITAMFMVALLLTGNITTLAPRFFSSLKASGERSTF